ncbi:MAG: preprotein translocase subunit SecE [Candidatus Paceibacterota bacterium]
MGKIFSKIRNYFDESWRELKKVNWPTQHETVKKTVGVLTLSLFIALVLGFLDFGLLQIMKLIIK